MTDLELFIEKKKKLLWVNSFERMLAQRSVQIPLTGAGVNDWLNTDLPEALRTQAAVISQIDGPSVDVTRNMLHQATGITMPALCS